MIMCRYAPATQLWRGRLHVMGGSGINRYTPEVEHWSLAVKDGKPLEKEWRSEIPIPRGGPHRSVQWTSLSTLLSLLRYRCCRVAFHIYHWDSITSGPYLSLIKPQHYLYITFTYNHRLCVNSSFRACVVANDKLMVIGGQEGDFMAKPGSPIFKCSRRNEVSLWKSFERYWPIVWVTYLNLSWYLGLGENKIMNCLRGKFWWWVTWIWLTAHCWMFWKYWMLHFQGLAFLSQWLHPLHWAGASRDVLWSIVSVYCSKTYLLHLALRHSICVFIYIWLVVRTHLSGAVLA